MTTPPGATLVVEAISVAPVLNRVVLQRGAYGLTVDWTTAYKTPEDIVQRAQDAGMIGIVAKACDGNALLSGAGILPTLHWWDTFQSLTPVAKAAGMDVIPWATCYPDDGQPGAAWPQHVAAACKLVGTTTVFVEPVMTDFAKATDPAASAQAVITALQQAVPGVRIIYACWGNPPAAGAFPWAQWNAAAAAVCPEIYYTPYHADGMDTMAQIWNNCWDGLMQQNPMASTVIPIGDFGAIGPFIDLCRTEDAPTIMWWSLDTMTAAQAPAVAQAPYKVAVTPPAPKDHQPAPSKPAAAGGRVPMVPSRERIFWTWGYVGNKTWKFSLTIVFRGPKGTVPVTLWLDTGDFEAMLPQSIADQLGLVEDGALAVQGVTGGEQMTEAADLIVPFGSPSTAHCVIDPTAEMPLWGARWFITRGYGLWVDWRTGLLEIYAPES